MFRTTSLRTKLLTALGVPLVALLFVVGLRVDAAFDRAAQADTQQVEIDRVFRIKDVAEAFRMERIAFSSFQSNADQSRVARLATDEAWQAFIEDPGDTPPQVVERLTEIYQFLIDSRPLIPLDPADFRVTLQTEVAAGDTGEGSMTGAVVELIALNKEIDSLASFDPNDLVDAGTAQDLTTLNMTDALREDVRTEQSVLLQNSAYPAEAVTLPTLQYLEGTVATTERAESVLVAVSSDLWADAIAEVLGSDAMVVLDEQRDLVIAQELGVQLTIDPAAYVAGTEGVLAGLEQLRTDLADSVTTNAADSKAAAEQEAMVAIGLAGVLLVALLGLVLALYRSIRTPITDLTDRSRQIAEVELPKVVATMRQQGAEGELPQITPLVADTDDEVGDLVEAFNEMAATAVSLAGEQAASRRIVADMFVNLGRRNQKLLLRMLNQLDSLQSDERDPDRLEQLFAVDHLATRMRRNAESLLVLAGARAARQFNEPIPVGDVLRSALTEVEDYRRVELKLMHEADIAGGVVADLSHLLAELIENALTFSPANSPVEVVAVETRNGYTIAVTDQGMGLSSEDIAQANERIAAAANEEETPSKFLGLHVVGRLASRHGLDVELLEGIPNGVTARIRVPVSALGAGLPVGDDGGQTLPAAPAGTQSIPAAPQLVPAPVPDTEVPAAEVSVPAAEVSVPAAEVSVPVEAASPVVAEPPAPPAVPEIPVPAALAGGWPTPSVDFEPALAPAPETEAAPAAEMVPAADSAPVAEAVPPAPPTGPLLPSAERAPSADPAPASGFGAGLARRVPGASGLAAERRAATGGGSTEPTPSVFGSVRRDPGANLPAGAARTPGQVDRGPDSLESALPPAPADPRSIASSLSSFQSATRRADEERSFDGGAAHDTTVHDEGENR